MPLVGPPRRAAHFAVPRYPTKHLAAAHHLTARPATAPVRVTHPAAVLSGATRLASTCSQNHKVVLCRRRTRNPNPVGSPRPHALIARNPTAHAAAWHRRGSLHS